MSEHTMSRETTVPEGDTVQGDGRPTAADTRLDQLLAAADEELSQCLDDALDLTDGLQQLASLPSCPAPPRPAAGLNGDALRCSNLHNTGRPGERTRIDDNQQLQEALDLLQHTSDQFHGLVSMTDNGPSSLETARSKLTHAQLVISRLITKARGRTLTRTQNTAAFNDIHDCVNTAWTTVAQTLESPAADPHAVLLDDALDTLDGATQRITQAHRILDHLLNQIEEDLDQPLPA
ncbi:hypothetical protein [Streptomyces sp. NBC_00582]|uniref:hypothetical protein n=1 Tax=Streptomyces sp. NBC_00582 TaxID=2975783 RepID=UPI002E8126D9|nr:hypothetical protein [Streptomyces sp. NBC_00582]WUB58958.1 hypothetical protein OG852_00060 [Streptomyces sp. NBC_00582]WUB67769.1 hypothetical protein OG852_49075 [Streptomyces sp. NBC_00582]